MRCIVALTVTLSLALVGCEVNEVTAPSPAPSTAQEEREAWERVPAKQREAFLAVLAEADPGLVDGDNQRERGLRRAVYTCRDIEKDGLADTRLAIYISQRFTGGHGSVSIAEGRALAKAITRHICPSL